MSEMKHTPGPWSVIEHNWSDTGIVSGNEYICLLEIRNTNEECEVAMSNRMAANASLIASAPDLLRILNGIAVLCEDNGEPVDGFAFRERVIEARAAIKKATGA
jgi:hypothetical protein